MHSQYCEGTNLWEGNQKWPGAGRVDHTNCNQGSLTEVPGQRASQLSDRSEQGKCETVTAQGGGAEGASGRSARCGPRQNSGMQKGKDGEGEEERKTERKGKRQEQGRKPRLKLWLWIRVMLREASLVNVDCE